MKKNATQKPGRPASGKPQKVPSPSMLIYDVPAKLRVAFKLAVTAKGSTISATVRELLAAYVKNNPVK